MSIPCIMQRFWMFPRTRNRSLKAVTCLGVRDICFFGEDLLDGVTEDVSQLEIK